MSTSEKLFKKTWSQESARKAKAAKAAEAVRAKKQTTEMQRSEHEETQERQREAVLSGIKSELERLMQEADAIEWRGASSLKVPRFLFHREIGSIAIELTPIVEHADYVTIPDDPIMEVAGIRLGTDGLLYTTDVYTSGVTRITFKEESIESLETILRRLKVTRRP